MGLLISAAEVVELAFGGDAAMSSFVDDAAVSSAQRKHIKPLVGGLMIEALEAGRYPELTDDYVKPALAQWVKYSLLPSVSSQIGAAGVVRYTGQGFDCADDKALVRLMRRTRECAVMMSKALTEHLETSPGRYPEYDPADNIHNKVSIAGGVVL